MEAGAESPSPAVSVANLAGGAITGGSNGVSTSGGSVVTVTTAGAITGTSGAGVSITANNVSVTNPAGGIHDNCSATM
jgi:hypothetical protein